MKTRYFFFTVADKDYNFEVGTLHLHSKESRNKSRFHKRRLKRVAEFDAFSSRGGRLSPQQDVDLLLDPVLVIRRVRVGRLLIDETRQV